jgi:DNA polymerase
MSARRLTPKTAEPDDTAARYIAGQPLGRLRRIASSCTACDLHVRATQTVFGEGPCPAPVMLVGEQPGNDEDLAGKPFVGPAGRMLDKALADAGIDRSRAYVTNVVKHFKWIVRGKKRIHQKPTVIEIESCRPWLDAEIERVAPEVVIALGATAAQALYGKDFRVTRQRGVPVESGLPARSFATIHPSSILRMPDRAARAEAYDRFVDDLRAAVKQSRAVRSRRR